MRNFQKHNAWVSERLGDLVAAVAKSETQRVEEIKAILLVTISDHGEGSDGFGMNDHDLRYHLNHAESRLFGDGDKREGIANFLDRKESQLERMSIKLRDLSRKATRGQDVDYARQELTDEIQNLTVIVGNLRDQVYPIDTVYGILVDEAGRRGIEPVAVETAPVMTTAAATVKA